MKIFIRSRGQDGILKIGIERDAFNVERFTSKINSNRNNRIALSTVTSVRNDIFVYIKLYKIYNYLL